VGTSGPRGTPSSQAQQLGACSRLPGKTARWPLGAHRVTLAIGRCWARCQPSWILECSGFGSFEPVLLVYRVGLYNPGLEALVTDRLTHLRDVCAHPYVYVYEELLQVDADSTSTFPPLTTDPGKMKAWLALVCACMLLLNAASATHSIRMDLGSPAARRLQQAAIAKDPTTKDGARLCR
jgi:hypothetical protein